MADIADILTKVILGQEKETQLKKGGLGQKPKETEEEQSLAEQATKEQPEEQKVQSPPAELSSKEPTVKESLLAEAVDTVESLKDLVGLIEPSKREKFVQILDDLHNILTGG